MSSHFGQGTLDAMLHGSLWDPEDDVKENVGAYINEVCSSIDCLVARPDLIICTGSTSPEAWRSISVYLLQTAALSQASLVSARYLGAASGNSC